METAGVLLDTSAVNNEHLRSFGSSITHREFKPLPETDESSKARVRVTVNDLPRTHQATGKTKTRKGCRGGSRGVRDEQMVDEASVSAYPGIARTNQRGAGGMLECSEKRQCSLGAGFRRVGEAP